LIGKRAGRSRAGVETLIRRAIRAARWSRVQRASLRCRTATDAVDAVVSRRQEWMTRAVIHRAGAGSKRDFVVARVAC
jgi:hypothetical protein